MGVRESRAKYRRQVGMREKPREREREREREKGREGSGERKREGDSRLVVSSTPRRIRRTSNSSADRYGFLVDSREGGLQQRGGGGSGWKKQRREGVSRGWVPRRTRERRWCLWGAGVVWRAGTPRGCFHDDRNYRQGWPGAHQRGDPLSF